jgi:transcriptional regulator with XRE-family HTH domain
MDTRRSFADQLRWWRARRGMSQLELAGHAGVSQRHLSFLELGRTAPSRDMVLRLAAALDLPLRQQNTLLLAGGFAPIWRESPLDADELAMVNRALDFILAQHEPYPAFVVDRRWQMLRFNHGGRRLVGLLTGTPLADPDPSRPVNLADALMSPDGLRPFIANWPEVALYFVRSVHADALSDGTSETAALLKRLLAYPDAPPISQIPDVGRSQEPVLAIHFATATTSLRLFTTLATLGTPQHITAQEIRIECFFPADQVTAETLRGLALA